MNNLTKVYTAEITPVDTGELKALTRANTDGEIISKWLKNKSPQTQESYKRSISQFWEFTNAHSSFQIGLTNLTSDEVEQWRDQLVASSSGATVKAKIAAVKSLLKYAHALGYSRFDVGKVVSVQSSKDTISERILSPDQVTSIINSANLERDRVFLKALYRTGARVSEMVNLKFTDLGFNQASENYRVHIFGKGNKSRYVNISVALYEEILSLKGKSEFVFNSNHGKQLSRIDGFRIFKNAAKKAGLKEASPHWFRHSHATNSLANGASLPLVSATLGHSDIAVTGKYLHINPKESSGDYLD
jgi:integrase/recombinase XerD